MHNQGITINYKSSGNSKMIGQILKGQYQIVQVLSCGGFCQTYLAQDLSLPEQPTCVIKQLLLPVNPHSSSLATLRRLFTREAQALEKLGHYPQVPQLLAYFEEDQQFYLVQEFIDGHPLTAELQPGQRWQESQVIELLQEILSILEVVHAHGLIHRDIKPSNLMRRESDNQIILIDFGSVKQAWTQVVTTQGQTNANFAVGIPATLAIGTPGYMPSEQGRGRPRPNSDIYALGMIGIQALTGLHPAQLLEDSETGEIIWQHHAYVSPELARVLNQMVRYHFHDRYQSVSEVMQALQPLTADDTPKHQEAIPVLPVQLEPDTKLVFENDYTPAPSAKPRDAVPRWMHNSALLIGLAIGVTSALVLILSSYYFLRPPAEVESAPNSSGAVATPSLALANLALAHTLTGHTDTVWAIAVSPDGQTLVSSSGDKTIKLWNLDTGQLLHTLSGHSDTVRSISLSADGRTLASGSGDKTIKLWNLETGKLLNTIASNSGPVWSVAITSDGQTLVSGGEDGAIKLWNLQTGKLRRNLLAHSGRVFSVALSPDGQTCATGGIDKTIRIWNLQTGKLLHTLAGHTDAVRSVIFSPDGQMLASSSWDKTIKIWNLQTGELLRTLEGHSERVVSVTFSQDGQTLASSSTDQTIKIWAVQTGKLLRNLTGHSDWVIAVITSPVGQTLLSSSKDKTIKIWQH